MPFCESISGINPHPVPMSSTSSSAFTSTQRDSKMASVPIFMVERW
ncbi:MAG: hypothetical protein SPK72_06805 [Bacteroidales bacterium]|nr:hypothetical protein [Bacteroidales bacterium]